MKTKNRFLTSTGLLCAVALAALNSQFSTAHAQTTAITYQGQLNSGNGSANGSYDLRFAVYDANVAGNFIAGPITNSAVVVSNGLFTVALDFGAGIFTGTNYWVELGVRTNGGGGFATLVPRQPLTPTPYALYAPQASNALYAAQAGSATALSGSSPQITSLCPPGAVIGFAGASAPTGWLLCNGSSVPTATYPALFTAIGYTYGGSGSQFILPDMRGRTGIGAGTGPLLTTRSLGQAPGEETHTLIETEIPSHLHSINLNTFTNGAHTHTFPIGPGDAGARDKAADGDQTATGNPSTSSAGNHFHSVVGNTGGGTGGNGAHNVMQPSLVLNYIIKY